MIARRAGPATARKRSRPQPNLRFRNRSQDSLVALAGALGPARTLTLTWGQLVASAQCLADELSRRPWRRPLLFCSDRFHGLVGLLACWMTGRPAVLPPNGRWQTWRDLLAAGVADEILHDEEAAGALNIAAICARANQRQSRDDTALVKLLSGRGDDHLITLHTSGSTGQPVAIRKTAGQILGEAETLAATFAIGPGTRVLATAPAHHLYGLLFGVLAPLLGGGAFVRDTALDAARIAHLARARKVDVLCAVPAHLATFEALSPSDLGGVRRVFSSGAPLPAAIATLLRQRFRLQVTEVLGSSESGGIAWRRAGAGRTAAALDWTPLPGVKVAAASDGVLLLRSPFVDPHGPRPWRGVDRIRMTGAKRFRHLGRADDILKVAGTRVSLIEIERRLLSIEGVRDAKVIALDEPGPHQHEICAAVVAPGLSAPALRRALALRLDGVAIPRRFKFVDSLPRAPTGKLPRADLVALFDGSAGVAPLPSPPSRWVGP